MNHLKRLTIPAAVVGLAVVAALTGCSSGSPGATTSTSASSGSSGVAAAKANVAKYSKTSTDFVAPGAAIKNVSSLSGKKVMYIPANGVVPYFGVSLNGIKSAMGALNISVTECDAQANPSSAASCLNQALSGGYDGVIIDSLPPIIAQDAFNAVMNAGVPILLLSQTIPSGSSSNVQATGANYVQLEKLAADVIVSNSNGTANTLAVAVNDSPITVTWMTSGAQPEFKAQCPSCKLNIIYTKTTALQQLPSLVSAALLKEPGTNYILPEFGAVLDGSIQGAQNASRTDTKVVSTTAGLENMQRLKNGTEIADVGFDLNAQGWYATDTMIRMMLKLPVDTSKTVITPRIFTKSSLKGLSITQAGWQNSSWYGGTAYQDKLKTLWGVK